jgi:hypothetical protein
MSFSSIIAIIKIIPAIKSAFDDLVAFYVRQEIAEMKAGNRAAIKKALEHHDQRDIEKQMGNPNAGGPSGVPGTVIRDDLRLP